MDDGEDQLAGWTPVVRKGRRSDDELRQEFWNEIGFPTPASRTWEHRSSSPLATEVAESSVLGMPHDLPSKGACHSGASRGRSSTSGVAMGAAVSKPVRLGWRGPVPRPRITPPVVLGMFLPTSPAPEKGLGGAATLASPIGVDHGSGEIPGPVIADHSVDAQFEI